MSADESWRAGFRRPTVSFSTSTLPDLERAKFRVRKALPEIVHATVALEDNPMTPREVHMLLDGFTVGGHRVADTEQVLNQAASWKRLLNMVSEEQFAPDKATACELQSLVARNEALEWGRFRTGDVSIAGTDFEPPPVHELDIAFAGGMRSIAELPCLFGQAMSVYLMMARQQFFWDGNKRTGRLLMNGILLSKGYDAICVPARRRQEFDETMIGFYDTGHPEPMMRFLASCSLDQDLRQNERHPAPK